MILRSFAPLLATACGVLAQEAAPKPNILFIFCDDLGYGDVGVFHQNERAAKKQRSIPYFHTPHLDGLAREGIQFRQHYCAAPVCAPSRASLLTGTHQGHSPIRDNQFDKELPDTLTLGSVLKLAGYATAAFGKWGLQGAPNKAEKRGQIFPAGVKFPGWPSIPVDRGFDHFFGYVRHRDGHYHYPVEDKKQVWENKTEVSAGMELCFTTDLFTAAAKKWIVDQHRKDPDQPFMVYLAHDTPHAILQNPPCAYPEGGGLEGGVQWIGEKGRMINTTHGTYDGWMHPDYARATWDHDRNPETEEQAWPDVQRRYANNVRRIDDTVGDLCTLLADLGIAENTLVIFSSDNGPSQESYLKNKPYHPTFFHGFGPFDGIKRDTLEGGLRVPTIARWPKLTRAGRVTKKPSGHWDWLPTFAEAAGLTAPAASDGVSLMPTLSGKSLQAPSTIYCEYAVGGKTPNYEPFAPCNRGRPRDQMQVIHLDGYKGIRTGIKEGTEAFRIYDLKKDPKETLDLADKQGMADVQKNMQAAVLQNRLPNPSAKRPYDETLIPAQLGLDTKLVSGFSFQSFNDQWPWMPQFHSLGKATIQGKASCLAQALEVLDSTAQRSEKHRPPLALELRSSVRIPQDGRYQFKISGQGHSMLFVHNIRLISENRNAGQYQMEAALPLKAGWHPIRYCYRSRDKLDFDLKLIGPDGSEIPLEKGNIGLHFPTSEKSPESF